VNQPKLYCSDSQFLLQSDGLNGVEWISGDRVSLVRRKPSPGREEDRAMATAPKPPTKRKVDYPTSDGKPMAETELHWQVMVDTVETLREYYAEEPMVHVGGNLLLFYVENNRRKHVSPDVFMVRGIPKFPLRDYYLLWEEGKPPDVVVEITSKTTKQEDQKTKHTLYRDVLKIPECFQFDPTEDYLKPSLQGVRRVGDDYVAIEPVNGRLPSTILGLHLERSGWELRLWDPVRSCWLLTPKEQRELARRRADEEQRRADEEQRRAEQEQRRAEQEQRRAEQEQRRAEQEKQRADEAERRRLMERQTTAAAQQQLEAENERLRQELEVLRRGPSGEKKA
jgi:Uma2 family endonuclease